MTGWTDYQDDISDAISDSMDVDWSANDGARAVVRWLNENKPLSTTPRVTVPVEDLAGKLKAIRDKFLMPTPDKDFTDYAIMTRCVEALSAAPAPEGGAVWFGVTGAADETEALAVALFVVRCPGVRMTDEDLHYYRAAAQRAMQAVADELDTPALATREEAPADNVTILITRAQREAAKNSGKKLNDWIGGILQRAVEEAPAEHHERNLAMTNAELIEQALSHPPLEAPAEAGDSLHPHAQPFEKYPELALHIERMAMSGVTGSLISWDAFLRELNAALATREEAPASLCDHGHTDPMALCSDCEADSVEAPAEGAGEHEALAAIMHRNMIPDEDGGFSFHDLKAADQIMDYLRARSSAPEAREEAQPVAWRLLAQQQPKPGHKIITLHDDGSGAALLFVHDGGVIDSDGGDYDTIGSPQTRWAYLPDDFEFWCEGLPEEPVTLPAHRVPDHPAPDALRVAVEALEAIKEVSGDRAASGYNETGRLARINERCDQALAALQQDALSAAPGEAGE